MKEIRGILVSTIVPMENHMANGGEKLLGNASSIKRRPDGKVYISGQMQRHALFSAINRLNSASDNSNGTYVSNGDGVTNRVDKDLRSDMGGFLLPKKGDYSGRRIAPLSVTPAVALGEEPSSIGRDLLIRIKQNESADDQKQALATKEYSEMDFMHMNFFLDVSMLSIRERFEYKDNFHIKTEYIKLANEEERKRRIQLFLEATRSLTDYANMARNAVSGEPIKVLLNFDTKLSRKASRYLVVSEKEQHNIIKELESRGAEYFIGNDAEGDVSVFDAYSKAFEFLGGSALADPSNGEVKTFEDVYKD